MNSNKKGIYMKYAFCLLSALTLVSCTSKPARKIPVEKQVSIESKQVANEEQSNFVAEVTFAKGRTGVPVPARSELKRIFQSAHSHGKIKDVKVITWADEEYPSTRTDKLSKAERRLVNRRNDAIEDYLESLDKNLNVDRFSMAERPGMVNTMLATEDVRIKRSLEKAGIANTDSNAKFPGKASKSIVIFVME
jgi:hypothetical protein